MNSSRRHFFKTTLGGGGALLLSSCERITTEINQALGEAVPPRIVVPEGAEIDPDFHLLSRAAYGPWPGDLARIKRIGRAAWLEEQLRPEGISDTLCDLRAERFESLYFSAGDAYEFRKPVLRDELMRHTFLRAVYSQRQLFEVMVEFWTDHLNIDLSKGDCVYLKPSDDRDVIRRHALGNFRDLIRASATSPAMLVYLDGKSNKVRRGSDDKPNENYARELLELHTLGVDGGYTQQDVREAARCLSGWTFDRNRFFAMNQSEGFFRNDWHDDGAKKVLGQTIAAGGGEKDLDALIDIACRHPSTAKFIATKLCHRFVSYEPPANLVDRLASVFALSDGDIRATLRALFGSEEFMASRGALLKRPFRFVVSALRSLGADTYAKDGAIEPLNRMGQGMFQYPTPDGYPDEEAPWLGTLMWRWNYALALAANEAPDVRVNLQPIVKALGGQKITVEKGFAYFTGRSPTSDELIALNETIKTVRTDPSAKVKTAAKTAAEALMCGIIMASPAYQRC
ncbi:MAG: DUF1800 domain-containing protein [Verrucomicrobiaceae bacterium]|nr:DUF1800 domain-containing protein [Verrucomicrobiaceae bacterium]